MSSNLEIERCCRTVPAAVDINGAATNSATVTVNNRASYRKGEYFWNEYWTTNTAGPVYLSLTNLAVLNNGTNADIVATNIGWTLLPKSPEVFGYDADGNLTNDGRWAFYWDAENRLTNMTSLPGSPTASLLKLDFLYDYQGRRVQKVVWANDGTNYYRQATNRYVYDGWNLTAVLDGGNTPLYSFQWSLDASGTMQGAGGVGGLLSMKVHSGSLAGTYFYCYDGNYNVVEVINAATGTPQARYEYGPFGELIRATGPLASTNCFQFSTKYHDPESDLVYYGFRYYNPSTGRWLSRDPVTEEAFAKYTLTGPVNSALTADINLYQYARNDGLNYFDYLGAGILCNCTAAWMSGITITAVDASGKPTMDGGIGCGSPNLGAKATRTVTFGCENRIFVYYWCFDCRKRTCSAAGDYVCRYTRGSSTGRWGYYWESTGTYTITRNCP